MDRLKIASELLKVAETLTAGSDYHYIYDPEHKKHPGGGYQKTEKGWQKGKEQKSENGNGGITDEVKTICQDIKNGYCWTGNYYLDDSTIDSIKDKKLPDGLLKTIMTEFEGGRSGLLNRQDVTPELIDDMARSSTDYDETVAILKNPKTKYKTIKFYRDQLADNPTDWSNEVVGLIRSRYKQEVLKNNDFDITKLSPELREKIKDWDEEDIRKFLGWLKANMG